MAPVCETPLRGYPEPLDTLILLSGQQRMDGQVLLDSGLLLGLKSKFLASYTLLWVSKYICSSNCFKRPEGKYFLTFIFAVEPALTSDRQAGTQARLYTNLTITIKLIKSGLFVCLSIYSTVFHSTVLGHKCT